MKKEEYIKAEMERFETILRKQVEAKEALIGHRFLDASGAITVIPALISQRRLDDGELKEKSFLMMMGVEKKREYNKTVVVTNKKSKTKKQKPHEEDNE